MKKREIKYSGASIRARLTNIAKETKRDFDALLLQYFQERFLYRLSISPFRSTFVLKGALLFLVYGMPFLRPTKDVDFLARSKSKDLVTIKEMIQEIARTDMADGVTFIPESISLENIMEDADYEGIRIKINGSLDKARKTLQIDIAFGDVLVAGPVEMEFPVLLDDQLVPRLKVYSKESTIAEKFQSLVKLNILTSRMKDIYDILMEEVEFWVRNLERQERFSFWLQTSTDKFYPDFVCKLKDGRYLVIEYKGADRWSNDDSKEKLRLGELWALKSRGQCMFVMPKGKDWGAIKAAIK